MMFFTGDIVEIRKKEFEFYFQDKPSGEYARGKIVDNYCDGTYDVKLFCNNKTYILHQSFFKKIYS